MRATLMACFDQFRAITGFVIACFLFCQNAVPRRSRFPLRVALCVAAALTAALAWVPLQALSARLPVLAYGLLFALYWIIITALVCAMVYACFELTPGELLFRCLLGCVLESVPTTLIRYLVVMLWLPELPMEHPLVYILLVIVVYALLYIIIYIMFARQIQSHDFGKGNGTDSPGAALAYFINFLLVMFAISGISEWAIPTMGSTVLESTQGRLLRYFCVGIRFLVSTMYFVELYYVCRIQSLQHERDLTDRLLKERREQYEFTKENIEFIQRKSHDLKRQLQALEFADDDERKAVMEETRRAAEFYDINIHTGHEVIDTLLTQKNMLCANHDIKLSCTVLVRELGSISTVDLYTMLSNALDNAIESTQVLTEPGMKTIRFSMMQRGQMLCIEVENYYSGTLSMRDGLPLTSKTDSANHGIGLMSIRTLARHYGGDIHISTQAHIFLLQIVIPLSE